MTDIYIRQDGHAGRITLNRPKALNALTYEMCLAIENALWAWRSDPTVKLVLIEAQGNKAFCSGGDIAEMFATGSSGDYAYGQRFWRDEYRMNALVAEYPKPVISFLQGFTMGGGVGVGCHGSHRVVGESSKIAMPECGIGLIPDVGGSYLLARAPGRIGEYLGLTTDRMGPGDAIFAGFADLYIPEDAWPSVKASICADGNVASLHAEANQPPASRLQAAQPMIDRLFADRTLKDVVRTLREESDEFAKEAFSKLSRNAPLSMACTLEILHRLRSESLDIRNAFELEYRFTSRSMEKGDFIEGIRAAIITKDKAPNWRHSLDGVPDAEVTEMLRPVEGEQLTFARNTQGMKIGFIGLGNMGAPMAANLAKARHDVTGYDMATVTVDGVSTARTAEDAAREADVVITMLPNGDILRAVAAQIIPAMRKGAVLLDCSTVDVDSARAVAADAEAAGLLPLDAPVSGGIGGAAAGTLTFMVGGSDEAYQTALPLFETMGQKSVHCGSSGNGQAAKICNNMILGVTMIATCEAFALADKLGLDRQAMYDVVSTSSGYSWSMNAYCPAPGIGPKTPSDNGYAPGFASELMLKDLRLSQQAADASDADTPLGQAATELYRQFVEEEEGLGRDFSAMLPRFEKRGRG
jgi:3-hydroxyisobutyrate dehydrogenase